MLKKLLQELFGYNPYKIKSNIVTGYIIEPRQPDKLDEKIEDFNKMSEGKAEPLKAEDLCN